MVGEAERDEWHDEGQVLTWRHEKKRGKGRETK
jgi:hypothetical protein